MKLDDMRRFALDPCSVVEVYALSAIECGGEAARCFRIYCSARPEETLSDYWAVERARGGVREWSSLSAVHRLIASWGVTSYKVRVVDEFPGGAS